VDWFMERPPSGGGAVSADNGGTVRAGNGRAVCAGNGASGGTDVGDVLSESLVLAVEPGGAR